MTTTTTTSEPSAATDTKCKLPILDSVTDAWLLIAEKLGDEDLRALSTAYRPFGTVANAHRISLRRQIRCFYLRVGMGQTILGVGVNRTANGTTRDGRPKYLLSSEFDFISIDAFRDHNASQSVWGQPMNGFLPLVFSQHHYRRAKGELQAALMWLAGRRGGSRSLGRGSEIATRNDTFVPWDAVEVVSKMMNQMVVSLMKEVTGDARGGKATATVLHASEKALTGYCALLHLLMTLAVEYPSIAEEAYHRVSRFLSSNVARTKENVPDLGEFLILLALVPAASWDVMGDVIVKELLARNVVWAVRDRPYLAEKGDYGRVYDEARVRETFEASKTSLRLLMFQVQFLKTVVGKAEYVVTETETDTTVPTTSTTPTPR
ncbi:hypothetical protein HK104_005198, partial [Borealophlyctis nickersoniae]